ncbi:MAG TPA: hypothetical protein VIH62_01225 [Xanthobacteraceae bacterium]
MLEMLSNLESHHPMLENLSVDRRGGDRTNRVSFTFLQLRVARLQRLDAIRVSTSQVLLAADAVLATQAQVAVKLRPGGGWGGDEGAIHPTDAPAGRTLFGRV